MAVFLGVGLVVYSVLGLSGTGKSSGAETGIFGGPLEASAFFGDYADMPAVFGDQFVVPPTSSGDYSVGSKDVFLDAASASLGDSGQLVGSASLRDNLLGYRVQEGDTLSGIASYFGVSLDTIINANPSVRAKLLRVGDTLNILPTSGIVYKTSDGDTLESIAAYFNIPEDKLAQFNKSVDFSSLGPGISLMVPGIENTNLALTRSGSLPNYDGNFIRPTDGFNWGKLHHYNAVDIANTCGTTVVAAAEGLVVPDDTYGHGVGGWNGGYGNFVLIEHPFGDGVRTRYAHLDKVIVDIGDYVKQGQEIGTMGQTGDATGCHVHFEVYGAENPMAK